MFEAGCSNLRGHVACRTCAVDPLLVGRPADQIIGHGSPAPRGSVRSKKLRGRIVFDTMRARAGGRRWSIRHCTEKPEQGHPSEIAVERLEVDHPSRDPDDGRPFVNESCSHPPRPLLPAPSSLL